MSLEMTDVQQLTLFQLMEGEIQWRQKYGDFVFAEYNQIISPIISYIILIYNIVLQERPLNGSPRD